MASGGGYGRYLKRWLDIFLAGLALILCSPILAITAILVRVKLGSPVVFKQARPGMHEKIFFLYKFRSMTNAVGADGRLLPDSQRLTKFGKFLRASSLDELLELVNILRGDMSIVGPRPLSIYYLPHYPEKFRRRHDVRPGLTGLAAVNGRNNLPWDERLALDIQYVEKLSFLLDVKIVLKTALKVLKHADIAVRGTTKVKDYGPYRILKEESNGGVRMGEMTYSEIGSYFWLDGQERQLSAAPGWLPPVADSAFTFSGRNAIEVALRDILKTRSVRRVLAPSYCCVSMLQSFIDHGLAVDFYEVGFRDGGFAYQTAVADEHTVVLVMSYFGLSVAAEQKAIEAFKSTGAAVIEDVTHSLLRSVPASNGSDYLVASLRKWFAVPTGGWVGKRDGALSEKPSLDGNPAVAEKIAGMREKFDYLSGKVASKENFLLTQAKFDNDLIHVDRMLKLDDTSLGILGGTDIASVVERRRRNVEVLLDGLKDLTGKGLMLPAVDLSQDTPLFLPVFLATSARDALRKHLVSRGIYCPVHWPEVMGASVGVRANELSLICDQRYSEGDMRVIANEIHSWFRGDASRDLGQ